MNIELPTLLNTLLVLFLVILNGLQLRQEQQQADQRNEFDDFLENDQFQQNLADREEVQLELQFIQQPIALTWSFPASSRIVSVVVAWRMMWTIVTVVDLMNCWNCCVNRTMGFVGM